MALRISDGGAYALLDDELEAFVRRAIEASSEGVLDTVTKAGVALADDARDQWPVKTGVSKAGLELAIKVDLKGLRVIAEVRNDVPYAIYIKPKVLHGASTAWQRYVRGPAKVAQKNLEADLVDAIIARVRGETNGNG